ncbi:NAD-dependent protein deacylase sirtuin-5, mitochondrial [Camelus ferus]|nr:NAD-dependent protein deacylase sirtuin-5, mitochondrial [Camelus ferus]
MKGMIFDGKGSCNMKVENGKGGGARMPSGAVSCPLRPARMGWAGREKRLEGDMADFRKIFAKAKHIAIISGAGDLATPQAFARNPSQVWEFYHYRREVVLSKEPNAGHLAIAECEARLHGQGRRVVVITQNIDELHRKAGTKNLLEIHDTTARVGRGYSWTSLDLVPKLVSGDVIDSSISLAWDRGGMEMVPTEGMWDRTEQHVSSAASDLLNPGHLVGTSSVVYPAALFAPQVSARGVPVAEFNMETTPATNRFRYRTPEPLEEDEEGDDEDDEAPEELTFASAQAEAKEEERRVRDTVRRDKTLLKEKRKRREELFIEQKLALQDVLPATLRCFSHLDTLVLLVRKGAQESCPLLLYPSIDPGPLCVLGHYVHLPFDFVLDFPQNTQKKIFLTNHL